MAITVDENNSIWIVTRYGTVFIYYENGFAKRIPGLGHITVITVDTHGNVWIGEDWSWERICVTGYYPKGISQYDGTSWITYTTTDGLCGNDAYAIVTDSLGNVWVGGKSGISVFDGINWKQYSCKDEIPSMNISSLTADRQERIWGVTDKDRTFLFDGTAWALNDTLAITSIVSDDEGMTWGIRNGEIARYTGNAWESVWRTTDLPYPTDQFRKILWNHNTLWASTKKNLWYHDGSNWNEVPIPNIIYYSEELTTSSISTFAIDPHGILWIGHRCGLSLYHYISTFDGLVWASYYMDDDIWHNIPFQIGLYDMWVASIVFDIFGNTWIGTLAKSWDPEYYEWEGRGVIEFDGETWKIFGEYGKKKHPRRYNLFHRHRFTG